MKSCSNCYWKFKYNKEYCACFDDKPNEMICDEYYPRCSWCGEEVASHKYEGECYCAKCLLEKFDVEEYTETHYMVDGKYLGSDDDMDEVIGNLSDDIEELD